MSEILVEFEGFELEPDSNQPTLACRFDYLEIWDGFPGGKCLFMRDISLCSYLIHINQVVRSLGKDLIWC